MRYWEENKHKFPLSVELLSLKDLCKKCVPERVFSNAGEMM